MRGLKDGELEYLASLEVEEGQDHPLDLAPRLDHWTELVWTAYGWLLQWSDGMGGLSVEALERWFHAPYPGARLDEGERRVVRLLVPYLIREDRAITGEETRRQREEAERRAAAARAGRR